MKLFRRHAKEKNSKHSLEKMAESLYRKNIPPKLQLNQQDQAKQKDVHIVPGKIIEK